MPSHLETCLEQFNWAKDLVCTQVLNGSDLLKSGVTRGHGLRARLVPCGFLLSASMRSSSSSARLMNSEPTIQKYVPPAEAGREGGDPWPCALPTGSSLEPLKGPCGTVPAEESRPHRSCLSPRASDWLGASVGSPCPVRQPVHSAALPSVS